MMRWLLILPFVTACMSNIPPRANNGDVDEKLCEHFRGEEPYDAQRARFIDNQIELYCGDEL